MNTSESLIQMRPGCFEKGVSSWGGRRGGGRGVSESATCIPSHAFLLKEEKWNAKTKILQGRINIPPLFPSLLVVVRQVGRERHMEGVPCVSFGPGCDR